MLQILDFKTTIANYFCYLSNQVMSRYPDYVIFLELDKIPYHNVLKKKITKAAKNKVL